MSRKKPCYMCLSAMNCDDLTHNNDYSAHTVCVMPDRTRLLLVSGWGKPLRLEYDVFDDVYGRWRTVGTYYPLYCPNCGRKVDSYERIS